MSKPKGKSKAHHDHSHTHWPPSSCGPLQFENEFLQLYFSFYQSAVLFSNPAFQQKLLLCPFTAQGQGQGSNVTGLPQQATKASPSSSAEKVKRTLKKAQRRLSSSNSGHGSRRSPSSTSRSQGQGQGSSGSTETESSSQGRLKIQKTLKTEEKEKAVSPKPKSNFMSSTPIKGKGNRLKRRVSFSKTPGVRERSNSNYQWRREGSSPRPDAGGYNFTEQGRGGRGLVPWITVQEYCWSSEMDESDTTEDENDTLGEGDDVVFCGIEGKMRMPVSDAVVTSEDSTFESQLDAEIEKFGQLRTTQPESVEQAEEAAEAEPEEETKAEVASATPVAKAKDSSDC